MSERFDLSDPAQYAAGIEAAKEAISKGELIVLPTDTVYGVGADAFTPWAVSRLLAAKGRGRDMPPPVLVGTVRAATALVDGFGPFGQDLIDEFWPGGLTLVARSTPTLAWDLGETRGTVAVRMPLHAAALDLLKKTGPMAVSSANTTGNPAATTADEAVEQLGDSIAVYLDGGPCGGGVASTIIDLTGSVPRLLRAGAIGMDRLREVATLVTGEEVTPPAPDDTAPDDTSPADAVPDDAVPDDAVPDDAVPDDAADVIDAPPDIPSDSPADARADALSSAAGPEDLPVAAAPETPAEIPAETPEAPAEQLIEDAAQAQQAADAPAAPVTSEAAAAEPAAPAAPAAPKPARARKPAAPRKPAARKPSTADTTATRRKPAAERTTTRRTTTRKPPAASDTPPAVSDPQPTASDTDLSGPA
jgi:tRNA threonylcarbamoyl adenosine modification protein (Sua5/YciO/YrdC/YwlC family)